MGRLIDPTASVSARAELGEGVRVGAYAVIGDDVVIGDDCEIGAGAQVQGPTQMGRENRVFPNACVGFEPQDLKFKGETSYLEIGDRNCMREFCTLNRGTEFGGGTTRIGNDNLIMAYSHVGHDSQVGSRVVFTNGATLAGHVEVGDDATIGAFSAVHQFCRVGSHAYIGGFSVITLDALPFSITVGQKPNWFGVNRVGLERKGFDKERIRSLDRAFRTLLRSGLKTNVSLAELRRSHPDNPDVATIADFVESSKRGFIRAGRKGGRGG